MKVRSHKRLLLKAQKAMRNAYGRFSRFSVGAAIETVDGKVFAGCNVENASYGGTICAERGAVMAAVAAGALSRKKKLTRVVVTSSSNKPVAPCGLCRQFLAEFAAKQVEVISVGKSGKQIHHWTLAELLPDAFTGADFAEGR